MAKKTKKFKTADFISDGELGEIIEATIRYAPNSRIRDDHMKAIVNEVSNSLAKAKFHRAWVNLFLSGEMRAKVNKKGVVLYHGKVTNR